MGYLDENGLRYYDKTVNDRIRIKSVSVKGNALTPDQNKNIDIDFSLRDFEETYNLIIPEYKATTEKGVDVIINPDFSVTLDGTATGNISLTLSHVTLTGSDLILSGSPVDSTSSNYYLYLIDSDSGDHHLDLYGDTDGSLPTLNDDDCTLRLKVKSGAVCNNVTFYPMIRRSSSPSQYVPPYISNDDLYKEIISLNNKKIPAGGTNKQILAKASNSDYDTEWVNKFTALTGTLDAGETELEFTNAAITSTARFETYTEDIYLPLVDIVRDGTTLTLTFPEQEDDVNVKVLIYED